MQNNLTLELTVFAGAAAAGVLAAFVYDLFRLKRRILKTPSSLLNVEDVLFWIFSALVLFIAAYALSSGETRSYFFLGCLLGAVVYRTLLSRPILWLLFSVYRLLAWPFKELIRLLSPVFRALSIRAGRVRGRVKANLGLKSYRVKVDFRRFKNVIRKR